MNIRHTALLGFIALGLAATGMAQAKPQPHRATAAAHHQQQRADGSSQERAIVIHENDTPRGIAAENRWIAQNMPGYRKVGQALIQGQHGIYDRISVAGPNGERKEMFFEISEFFGRYNGKLLGTE
ncbi:MULTISPECIES: hypothetical protein [Eikenella]|uniref:Uncharacterized protein n=1 Tax=Eikenella longinqua TaxID=1795827 RepID=A0A1A9S2P6_9NEIS|nr:MULTISPECIES: hypothetical protein [Eikenella]OAM31224.1 hypothetical protein A7P95_01660 [Eikenella longinqua]